MMLLTILKYRLRQTYNTLTHSSRQKKLGWLLSIAFIAPYYVSFTRSMSQMYRDVYERYQWPGLARMVRANLGMVFFFVLISMIALTLYRMFRAKDLPLLMSLPARDGSLFLGKITDLAGDLIRSMILPFPICIAFASVLTSKAHSTSAAVMFLVGWIGVMLQLAGLSIVFALILGRIIATSRWANLLRIIAVVAALAFLLIFVGYANRVEIGLPSFNFASLSMLLPTSWLMGLLPGSAILPRLLYGLGFIAMTVACPTFAFQLFKRRFRRLWMMSVEMKPRGGSQRIPARKVSSMKETKGRARVLMLKEVRVIRREPHIWIGLIIPLALFPVFILFRANEPGTQAVYITIVSMLATASYSLSCIGREGQSFPLLRSLPIRASLLLRAKLLMGCAVNLAVTITFVIALYLARQSSLEQMRYNVLIGAITSVYLSAFGTALAALFPKFDFTSPMRAASLPGLLALYLMAGIFGVTFLGAASAGWYFTPPVLIPWACIALIMMTVGQRRLERMDV